jgi:hypothetical protein
MVRWTYRARLPASSGTEISGKHGLDCTPKMAGNMDELAGEDETRGTSNLAGESARKHLGRSKNISECKMPSGVSRSLCTLSSAGVVDFACPSMQFLTFRNDYFEFERKLTIGSSFE